MQATGVSGDNRSQKADNQVKVSTNSPLKEESYITKDVVVNGSINSVGSLVIEGSVNGNVTTNNEITVSGTIEGNITATSAKFTEAKIKGDINCKQSITLIQNTVVNGNVAGQSMEVNCTVNGNLTAEQSAVIMGDAVINGDITAKLISVLEGAVIKGSVKITRNDSRPSAAAASANAGDAHKKFI